VVSQIINHPYNVRNDINVGMLLNMFIFKKSYNFVSWHVM